MNSVSEALCLALAIFVGISTADARALATPQSVVDELLEADREFAAAGSKTDVVSAISSMLAENASMPAPGGRLAFGHAQIVEALRANPENAASSMDWSPIRGGISADAMQGFTFGYITLRKSDGTTSAGKYLSYWVKQSAGWRVAAYRRSAAPEGRRTETMAPALPRALVAAPDADAVPEFERSLDAAERAFSAEAQRIGLGAAFAKFGSADAVNMGGPEDSGFVVGSDAIGRAVSAGGPATGSAVSWAPERVIVAASGDLGVTIGTISENEPTADGKPPRDFPFFTVWRRASADDEWRYVAE